MKINFFLNDIEFCVAFDEKYEEIDWGDTYWKDENNLSQLPYALYELLDSRIKHQFEVKVQEGVAEYRQSIKDEQRRDF